LVFAILQFGLGFIQGEGRALFSGHCSNHVFPLQNTVNLVWSLVRDFPWNSVYHDRDLNFRWKDQCETRVDALQESVWFSRLGFPQTCIIISLFLGHSHFLPMFIVQYLLSFAIKIGIFEVINPIFSAFMTIHRFSFSWVEGFSQGFILTGSYATGVADIRWFVNLAF
jgi:hypothetical protein